ncbi:MAG: tetratricopeptide repeat protein [Deltaproteobacteria bacterium]|nr:tetratricopeptide repeat protein [Deltaproteobacteria bacterium]
MIAVQSLSSNRIFLAGLLVALTLAAYGPTLDAGFIWDDDDYVTENPTLRTSDGLRRIWLDYGATPQYYPMVHTSYWLEYQLWGLEPAGFHAVNVLLHSFGAMLLWAVLAALGLPGAWFAAAIFAVHPVHVESVAWITERKNVLSGVFYMASVYAYLQSAGLGRRGVDEHGATRLYAFSLVCFAAALLSKTVTGSLPAVILLLVWWRRGRVGWSDVQPLIPYFLLAAGFGLLTARLETQHVGAVGWEWDLSFVDRILIAGRALWFYAGKLVWPTQLSFNYPRFEIDSSDLVAWLYPAAAVAVVIAAWALRARFGRGPLVAVLVFAGSLFPALGFFDVYPMRYSFVADHFQYLASVGLIALFAALAANAASRRLWPQGGQRAGGRTGPELICAGLVLALLTGMSWRQAHVYRDVETLWRDTLAKNRDSWLALSHLGTIAEDRGQLDEAVEYYRASLRVEPRQHEAHNNLGNALRLRGEFDEAAVAIERSLAVQPSYGLAHNSLGLVRHDQGEFAEAVRSFEHALEIDPDFAAAQTNLGITLVAVGDLDAAIARHRTALEIAPDLVAARTNLASALIERGDLDEAIEQLSRVVELDSDSQLAKRNLRVAKQLRARRLEAGSSPDRSDDP